MTEYTIKVIWRGGPLGKAIAAIEARRFMAYDRADAARTALDILGARAVPVEPDECECRECGEPFNNCNPTPSGLCAECGADQAASLAAARDELHDWEAERGSR